MTKKVKQDQENATHLQELEKALEEKSKALAEKETAYAGLENKYENQYNTLMTAAKQLAADFDNFRKRIASERQKENALATKDIVVKLIPLLDQFSLCLDNNVHHDEFVNAVSLLHKQLSTLLEDIGLTPIPAMNQPFDPRIHEVIMFIESDKEDNMVIEELQRGYYLHDEIIRHGKVKVTRKRIENRNSAEKNEEKEREEKDVEREV